jgi:hypothetical protein
MQKNNQRPAPPFFFPHLQPRYSLNDCATATPAEPVGILFWLGWRWGCARIAGIGVMARAVCTVVALLDFFWEFYKSLVFLDTQD